MKRTLPVALLSLALCGCGGTSGTTGHDGAPCTLSLHATEGYDADLTVRRYRFIGGSTDGTRVAVLYSHFGPASGAPFAAVYGWQAGARTPLFTHGCFMLSGGETELQSCEQQAMAVSAADMAAAGIVQGANLPTPLPWCADGDTTCLGAAPQRWRLSTFAETCTNGATIVQWTFCRADDGAACVIGTLDPNLDCGFPTELTRSVSFLDAFRASGVVWAVSRKRVETLTGIFFNATFVSGSSIANPPAL